MEWNSQTLQILSDCFLNSFSPLPEPRRAAEKALAEASEKPSFALAVLRLVAEPSVDEKIQQAAAVAFKNHLKSRWASNDGVSITDVEKEQIKALIVSLMLKATPKIQAQLSEALSVIGKHDFPKSWPTLLPELVSSLERLSQTGDYVSINGVLATLDSLFKKFGHEHKSDALWLDLKYCLDNFANPLLLLFQWTASLIDQAVAQGANAASLKLYIECQRLCCWIFYSLNYQDLPEFFEDHMSEWMVEFKKYLTVRYPALEDASSEGLELVDSLRAAVCVNISLYAAKDEESFQVYMSGFVEAVWLLLISTSASPSREQLTVTAIKFLSTVSRGVHHSLFASDSVLHQICEGIVIPNVMLREEDVELFDFDSIEFIRRDMEGSDVDTRRRIACELLKGIAEHYKENVTQKASSQIQSLLDSFSKNPAANWKHKDCAIYLVVSLASWKADGASFSIDLVNIESFFGSVIVPELRNQQVNDFPILKAAALKFFTTFRNQLSKPIALSLLPDLVRFLTSDSIVVHSYAASCIEKLLLVKDGEGRLRYTGADIGPSLMPLMNNLYGSLQKQESEENQYIMKCIMRVLSMADINPDVALVCIKYLTEVLRRVCANPKSPVFNHYLFESVAALVRRASERDRSVIPAFENCLFPGLQKILAEDISEFFPYAFQLLAQLVEITPSLDNYVQIFVILLSPDIWNKSANVPALVYLLQAFLRKSPHEMMAQQERLKSILEIFGRLVSSSRSSDQGFYVLNTVIENISYDVIQPHVGNIWRALFTKLHQNSKSVKLIKNLIVFMSLFLVRYGADRLVQSMNDVQADIFHTILTQFWIPNLKQITGFMELKLTSVASTKLICESPNILNSELWVKMLDSNVTLLCQPEKKRVDDELEVPDFAETAGYNASFARLYSVGKKDEDPLKEIKDPKQFFVVALSRTCAASPGVYTPIISNNLDQSNQAALLQLCNQFNVSLV